MTAAATEPMVAGLVAASLTFFESDRTFYVPPKAGWKVHLLQGLFLLLNAFLAAALYLLIDANGSLDEINPWVRAAIVGAGYLGLVRFKFVTIPDQTGGGVPFGFEYFYDELKGSVYRRVNRIAGKARRDQALEHASAHSLADLGTQAKLAITNDQLMPAATKAQMLEWVIDLVKNPGECDIEERAALSDFLLSGLPPHHIR